MERGGAHNYIEAFMLGWGTSYAMCHLMGMGGKDTVKGDERGRGDGKQELDLY